MERKKILTSLETTEKIEDLERQVDRLNKSIMLLARATYRGRDLGKVRGKMFVDFMRQMSDEIKQKN